MTEAQRHAQEQSELRICLYLIGAGCAAIFALYIRFGY
jgi:hypothetical protein